MFFDPSVMENEKLSLAWRAAHQAEGAAGGEADENLPTICASIQRWVKSEDGNPRRRLSLRSAAVLVAGGAKLCLKRGQSLLEDCQKLDSELTFLRKRPRLDTSDGQTSSEKSDKSSDKTPEKMMGRPKFYESIYITHRKRYTPFDMSPLVPDSPNISELNPGTLDGPLIHQPALDSSPPHLVTYSSSCQRSNDSKDLNETLPRPPDETKDASTQTDQADITEDTQTNPQFLEAAPFGLILFYDNFNSRLPNKILCTSLNADVRNLNL